MPCLGSAQVHAGDLGHTPGVFLERGDRPTQDLNHPPLLPQRTPDSQIDVVGVPYLTPALQSQSAYEAELEPSFLQGSLHAQSGLKQSDIRLPDSVHAVHLTQPVLAA